MVENSELYHVVNTLLHLQTQIKVAVTTLDKVYENKDVINTIKYNDEYFDNQATFQAALNGLLSNHCIILFCSFLDEYELFNPTLSQEYKELILSVRRKNEPGLDRIRKWKDLKPFRNELAAHNFKIKGKSFFSKEVESLEYIIPNTISEKKLFMYIIDFICLNILEKFPNHYNREFVMIEKINIIGEEINFVEEAKKMFLVMRGKLQ